MNKTKNMLTEVAKMEAIRKEAEVERIIEQGFLMNYMINYQSLIIRI